MSDIADLIESGASVLKDKGWMQGELWRGSEQFGDYDGGAVCSIGSLVVASGGGHPCVVDEDKLSVTLAYRAIEEHLELDGHGISLADWNDEPDRTLDEVVTAFLDTAREIRVWEEARCSTTTQAGDSPER